MDTKEIRQKMFDIRLQIAMLSIKERENAEHPLYYELKKLKHLYAKTLFEEKEKEKNKNEQYKTK